MVTGLHAKKETFGHLREWINKQKKGAETWGSTATSKPVSTPGIHVKLKNT
jgi:hypothetical protein